MGEEQAKSVESENTSLALASAPPQETSTPDQEKSPNQDSTEKALVPYEKQPSLVAEKAADHHENEKKKMDSKDRDGVETKRMNSKDRDSALARVELEKRWALIKAWEDSEKTKVDNRAYKKLSAIEAWENTRKASVDAELKQIEEEFEKKKAKSAEKMKNKMAEIHRAAEEKRAMVEAKRGEDNLMVDEAAAKFRATGNIPKRLFGCFGG